MDLGRIIGQNLNKLRTERGLTLGQLAKLSGISKAILSDIEKGGSNPTINTIWKIANGLNIPFTRLMEFEEPAGTVVRKADTAMQHGDTEAYRIYCYFASAPERNFELFYCERDAGASNTSIGHSPKAQEYIYVIEGELSVKTDAALYTLGEGDSLVFNSSVNHTYINNKNVMAKFMVINYYPC